ncbi:MAG: NRDE family protein [Steroidobacteraceae bacterium]
MCLLVLAWHSHPRYRLIVAANRDEFHDRPAAPLGPWQDSPQIVGGRDLRAGGAWLAVSNQGRFGVVTNYRELVRSRRSAPSRGALVPAFLQTGQSPVAYLDNLEIDAPGYAGFSLVLADDDALWYASNRTDEFRRPLLPGIYGLSNHALDTPWPKLERVRARFNSHLATAEPDAATLFEMLADAKPAPAGAGPVTGLSPEWAHALSSPFVRHGNYGTRCSTVVLISHDGDTQIFERRFDSTGSLAGETELALNDSTS